MSIDFFFQLFLQLTDAGCTCALFAPAAPADSATTTAPSGRLFSPTRPTGTRARPPPRQRRRRPHRKGRPLRKRPWLSRLHPLRRPRPLALLPPARRRSRHRRRLLLLRRPRLSRRRPHPRKPLLQHQLPRRRRPQLRTNDQSRVDHEARTGALLRSVSCGLISAFASPILDRAVVKLFPLLSSRPYTYISHYKFNLCNSLSKSVCALACVGDEFEFEWTKPSEGSRTCAGAAHDQAGAKA